jgi:hypothetical protein
MKTRISMRPSSTAKIVEGAKDEGIDEFDAGGVEHRVNAIIESQRNH